MCAKQLQELHHVWRGKRIIPDSPDAKFVGSPRIRMFIVLRMPCLAPMAEFNIRVRRGRFAPRFPGHDCFPKSGRSRRGTRGNSASRAKASAFVGIATARRTTRPIKLSISAINAMSKRDEQFPASHEIGSFVNVFWLHAVRLFQVSNRSCNLGNSIF